MGTIKSFKKFIKESIWSDIQDRSSGDVVRKEDDVNLLDLNEFYKYIKEQYKAKVEYIDLDFMGGGDVIGVDITENIILFYKPKRGHILLSWSRVKIPMPFFDELTDRFKVENPNAMRRIITEKDGSCTNKTFVDAIEFFLGHKESMMNESIWSDIQDRSSGETTRKEDDVNLLDKDGLYEYLISHYKSVDGSCISRGNSYINLCVFIYPKETRYSILLDILNCRVKVRTPYIKRWPINLLDMIDKKYNREDVIDRNRDHMTFITPKEGKGNNQFYIDFLDMILNNVDKPLLKKVINESIWSDIQDRSSGETIRKEDERHKILERLLATYIKLFAESCYYHNEYTSGSYPDFRAYIKDFRDNPKIEEVCPDDSYFDDLLNYVNKETWYNQIDDTIMEMTNRLYKGEHHLITDDVIEELRKHNVNESIWSDIQDRSSGNVVRKEDEYDIDEDELERGVEVSVRRYVIQSIYSDKYDGSSDTFLKCIQEWDKNICTNAQLYDRRGRRYVEPIKVIPSYIEKNWETGKSYKSLVDKKIFEEEKKIKDTGFVKKPGESISDTLSKWFDKNVEELEQDFCDEIEEHNAEYHSEGGSRYTDLGVEDWWDDLKYIDQIEIYQEYMKKTNESIWSDIQDRSSGDVVRKEDEMTQDDLDAVDDFIFGFATRVVWDGVRDSLTNFLKYIDENPEALDCSIDRVKKYVEDNWHKSICDDVEAAIEQEDKEKEQDMNESIWSDIQDRSTGDVVRKEDEMTSDDFRNLKVVLKMFGREVRFFGDHRNQNFFPVKAKKYKITLEDCLYYIDVLVDSKFTGTDFPKLKRYIEVNWEQDPMIKNIIQWTAEGKNSKEIDQEIRNASKSDEFWDLNECDGVPGGITPADVGGMGAAYFPGPNGEPGSGDLPSPTGIVYKQVAPFDTFIKIRRPKKNKKKKFRKEDEPCVHSPNAKVYDYVDDFRDYVDRTYNNIDKRK